MDSYRVHWCTVISKCICQKNYIRCNSPTQALRYMVQIHTYTQIYSNADVHKCHYYKYQNALWHKSFRQHWLQMYTLLNTSVSHRSRVPDLALHNPISIIKSILRSMEIQSVKRGHCLFLFVCFCLFFVSICSAKLLTDIQTHMPTHPSYTFYP